MPTRAVFHCQFCDAVPDHGTQRSLAGQVSERMFGEYLDAFPGRWLVWNGGGPLGPRRYACREHRGDLVAYLRYHYATVAAQVWKMPPYTQRWPDEKRPNMGGSMGIIKFGLRGGLLQERPVAGRGPETVRRPAEPPVDDGPGAPATPGAAPGAGDVPPTDAAPTPPQGPGEDRSSRGSGPPRATGGRDDAPVSAEPPAHGETPPDDDHEDLFPPEELFAPEELLGPPDDWYPAEEVSPGELLPPGDLFPPGELFLPTDGLFAPEGEPGSEPAESSEHGEGGWPPDEHGPEDDDSWPTPPGPPQPA